jgi:hypothetical protein
MIAHCRLPALEKATAVFGAAHLDASMSHTNAARLLG